ncbi:hypothetical protein ABPG75_002265 [Micractinium tetrahymenae]
MGDQIIYLEKYIDSTTSLPAELNRILNSIKDLDERSDDLAAQIQENVEAVLRMPPASGGAAATRGGKGGESKELRDLRAQIDKDQQLLIQFAEEKVQLAVQGYDLLEQHLGQADLDIVHLEAELQAMGMGDALGGMSMGGPDYSGGTFDEPAPKRGGSRLRDVPSFDSFEQAVPAEPKPRKTTITLNLSRQISGFEAAAAAGEAQTPGVDSLGAAPPQKRPASTAPRKAATPAPQPAAPPTEGYQRNRRAAAAGVHAVAAEVAAMEEDDLTPEEQHARLAAQQGAMAAAAAAVQQQVAVPMQGVQMPPAGAVQAGMVSSLLPPGLKQSADRPQAPGRLLVPADIGPGLVGRHAELFWPDSNLWYPIVVQSFDPVSRTAAIMYTGTGEAETLRMDDIVKEGHMSLLLHQPAPR